MKILVINPANKPFTNQTILIEPIDILQIATIIKQKFENVQVLDMDVLQLENNISNHIEDGDICIYVFDYQLPLHTNQAIDNILETVKRSDKKVKNIIIGKTASYQYKYFMENGFDIVFAGQCENTICQVIQNIDNIEELKKIPNLYIKEYNQIIKTEMNKQILFSDFPIPDRSLITLSNYIDTRTMVTSRGCIGTCSFCSTPYYFGKWQCKNYKDVVDEIELLVNQFQTKKIMFLDDNMIVDKKRMLMICEEIKKRSIHCLFGCLGSISCYDKEMFEKMYQVGFRWIHFGIESGSEDVLKRMHKKIDLERAKNIIKEVKKLGYRVRNSFILDYPGTTKEDIEKTQQFILETMPHEIRLHYLAYRVGTPIFNLSQVDNLTQYIHSNKPNIDNPDLNLPISLLIQKLNELGYDVIEDQPNWNNYLSTNQKIVAFVPIRYGMNWYE